MIDTIPDTQPTTDRQRREALYRAFEEHVDPKTYDGASCERCLIGQTCLALGEIDDPSCLALRYDVDEALIGRIYSDATGDEYWRDYAAAMQMAKERLGLT